MRQTALKPSRIQRLVDWLWLSLMATISYHDCRLLRDLLVHQYDLELLGTNKHWETEGFLTFQHPLYPPPTPHPKTSLHPPQTNLSFIPLPFMEKRKSKNAEGPVKKRKEAEEDICQ